jgi:hypothetical protein
MNRRSRIRIISSMWPIRRASSSALTSPCQVVRTGIGAATALTRSLPRVFYPYTAPVLAGPRLDNSGRLQGLIGDGRLRLTLDDAIAPALENNLEIARDAVRPAPCPNGPAAREGGGRNTWRGGIRSIHNSSLRQSGWRCGRLERHNIEMSEAENGEAHCVPIESAHHFSEASLTPPRMGLRDTL